jgi:hypothetical protein
VILARILANITGFVTLALLCGLGLGLFLGLQELRAHWTVYAGVYAVIAASGWWVLWRPDRDGTYIPWPTLVLGSIGLGAAFFVCDLAIGRLTHADLPLFEGAFHVSGPLGFGGTLIVCPGLTLMALSGWSRSLVLRHATRFV